MYSRTVLERHRLPQRQWLRLIGAAALAPSIYIAGIVACQMTSIASIATPRSRGLFTNRSRLRVRPHSALGYGTPAELQAEYAPDGATVRTQSLVGLSEYLDQRRGLASCAYIPLMLSSF